MRVPLTPYGLPEILLFAGLFLAAAASALLWVPGPGGVALALLPLAGLAFCLNFFRDPEREVPGDAGLAVAPADGTVADVQDVAEAPFVGGPAVCIGIFLDVFDVHVNRAPLAGRVELRHYERGLWLDARDPAASRANESCAVVLVVDDGAGGSFRVIVRQIAGLIARRIVCPLKEGDVLARGQRFGMIKFGSRTELYIPKDRLRSLEVAVGQKVRGGADALARVRLAAPAPAAGEAAAAGGSPA